MGYFNYFIKCIIRNITYRLCKPRNLLIIVAVGIILSFSASTCFATDYVISNPTDQTGGDNSQAYQYDDQFGHIYTMQYSYQERFIANLYANKGNPGFNDLVTYLFHECKNLGLSNKTLYVQHGIGNTEFVVYYAYPYLLNNYVDGIFLYGQDEYSYSNLPVCAGQFTQIGFINAENNVTTAYVSYQSVDMTVPFACLNVFNPSFIDLFKYYGLITDDNNSELEALNQKAEQTNESLNNINSTIDQGNQLQQEQNQLQQEQNDFLKQETSDDDVSVDGFSSVDANDVTSAGLTGVFTNIYNSITSWSSKDIKLPIPYTNKNITIPANYTQNMLSSFGGSWIITFISSIYYFIVARFIIYSITGIVNSIKSGSILETDSKNNITTDML